MVFQKQGDASVVLTIKNDNTATITKAKPGKKGIKTNLIEGKVEGQGASLIIVREEGDVCPSVSVKLYNDVKLGENMVAKVRNMFEEVGSARKHCAAVRVIDGSYSRVK
ncbi:hypothetical protein [Spirobacillus cienkowskii]